MPISINWATRVIYVPKDYMALVQLTPVEIRELNINTFRLALKDLEDSEEGMPFPDTHRHFTEVALGGLTYARVIEIINDYTITFEDDQYLVNLTGANSNIADRVNPNQVSVRSNNAAGLINMPAIEYSSFQNMVSIDASNITGRAVAGTLYPAGTRETPSNNLNDTLLIDQVRRFGKIRVFGPLELNSGMEWDVEGKVFQGDHHTTSSLYIESSALVGSCAFEKITLSGVLDNNVRVEDAEIYDIQCAGGVFLSCSFHGTLTANGPGALCIYDCYSCLPTDEFVIDMGGFGRDCLIHNFSGTVRIRNLTGNNQCMISASNGRIIIESTVSAGTVVIFGNCEVQDGHTGSAIVVTSYITSPWKMADTFLDESAGEHTTAGTLGGYIQAIYEARLTIAQQAIINNDIPLVRKALINRLELADGLGQNYVLFDDDDTSPLVTWAATDKAGGGILSPIGAPSKRGAPTII